LLSIFLKKMYHMTTMQYFYMTCMQSEIKKKAKKERNQPLVNALKEDSSNVSEETSKQRKWDLGQAFSDLLRKRL